jgi:hypothetical protein
MSNHQRPEFETDASVWQRQSARLVGGEAIIPQALHLVPPLAAYLVSGMTRDGITFWPVVLPCGKLRKAQNNAGLQTRQHARGFVVKSSFSFQLPLAFVEHVDNDFQNYCLVIKFLS